MAKFFANTVPVSPAEPRVIISLVQDGGDVDIYAQIEGREYPGELIAGLTDEGILTRYYTSAKDAEELGLKLKSGYIEVA